MEYRVDSDGNGIPDFSNAGYRGGGHLLPDVPVVKTLSPAPGDNTIRIQAALDEIGKMPLLENGYRGTLQLEAGIYEISGTLYLRESGVVLSGAGDKNDPKKNTIVRRVGKSKVPVIIAGGQGADDGFSTPVPNTTSNITSPVIPVGSRSFQVAEPSLYRLGDNVIIEHPSTPEWLATIDFGGARSPWRPGEIDIRYHRYITGIEGNTITVDAPVFNQLKREFSQARLFKYKNSHIIHEIGIKDLFVDIETSGEKSEDHARSAVVFSNAEDCWIRNVTTRHFVQAGICFGPLCTRSTALACHAIEPHSRIEGGRRYNFCVYHAQLILFEDCYASYARHAFISNGTSLDSGIVVLNCTNEHSLSASEGHRRWAQGLLFDNLRTLNPGGAAAILGLYNRGDYGTSHGWSAVNSVAWHCNVGNGNLVVQKPPTAQNYAIGCSGNITGKGHFEAPVGYIEGANRPGLTPESLYRAQLLERTKGSRLHP